MRRILPVQPPGAWCLKLHSTISDDGLSKDESTSLTRKEKILTHGYIRLVGCDVQFLGARPLASLAITLDPIPTMSERFSVGPYQRQASANGTELSKPVFTGPSPLTSHQHTATPIAPLVRSLDSLY
jgi:hypothetical protein